MIQYDKIKIVTSIDYISNINTSEFLTNLMNDEVLYYKYHQEAPYSLIIIVDYRKNELTIEFTGKILKESYYKLISEDTIRMCFDNINHLGLCTLDTEAIIHNSQVVKCDVTKDIKGQNIDSITSTIRQNLSNYNKWSIKRYNGGIVVEKVVSTPKYKRRLTIYDKGKEINKISNKSFVDSLKNSRFVTEYFDNIVRFELNLNAMYQIRQLLNIPNNNLINVLRASTNPILTVIDEAVKYVPQQHKAQTLRDYEHELLLKDCDYDMVRVEAKVRALSSKNTSITRMMQPYKELYKRLQDNKASTIDIRALVA